MILYKGLKPEMIKSLFEKCNDPVITYEARMFLQELVEPIELRKRVNNYWTFVVKDLITNYSVIFKELNESYTPICTCQTFQKNGSCSHVYAVTFSIYDSLFPNKTANSEENLVIKAWDQENENRFILDNVRNFTTFVHTTLKNQINISKFSRAKIEIKKDENGYKTFLRFNNMIYTVNVEVNKKNNLIIQCSCNKLTSSQLCEHASMVVFHLYNFNYLYPFTEFYNYDEEKNKLLERYGLTLDDKEASEFQFKQDSSGKMYISVIPPLFVSEDQLSSFTSFLNNVDNSDIHLPFQINRNGADIGIFFQFSDKHFSQDPITIKAFYKEKKKTGGYKYKVFTTDIYGNSVESGFLPSDLEKILNKFNFQHFKRSEIQNISYGDMYDHVSSFNFVDKMQRLYVDYFLHSLQKYWDRLSDFDDYFILDASSSRPTDTTLTKITLPKERPELQIYIEEKDRFLVITPKFYLPSEDALLEFEDIKLYFNQLLLWNDNLYHVQNDDVSKFLEKMPLHKLLVPNKNREQVISQLILPIKEKFNVDLPSGFVLEQEENELHFEVWLREADEISMVLEAVAKYGEKSVSVHIPQPFITLEQDEKFIYTKRKLAEESAFKSYVMNLHPSFQNQKFEDGFRIDFDDVMRNNWFLDTTKSLLDQGIHVVGINELKKFKYNSATPKWNMEISSGIDWFDVKIQAVWDDQVIDFKDLRNAILTKQNFVVLGDGSFGMIPEEWLQKYSGLFKVGVTKGDTLSLSKKQFNIIDILFDQIDDDEVKREFQEKKTKLLSLENIVTEPIPNEIIATLRPYQTSGYQWLQVLDEISWGGCLADDMGLGKTLQAITFLTFLKKKYNNPTSLIICPTSLIFNWENEIKKFAPTLKYFIYYGNARSFSDDHFEGYDVVITSYGIARIDIESLRSFNWEYVILDESQAIKNPDAITTKAVQLLKSRNKIILSGTPYQNNTFDLYAQFNFLNPGLLGNKMQFRENFAIPIDKEKHFESSTLLRKILQPFILRRTKKEVASDLPDKVETIIWCQMNKNQRAVYDEYKDFYRHSLMKKIDSDGMAKSGVYILEGLLRLRQICDDVRLLKDSEIRPSTGVKIEELLREILENSGDHKMLVFSQFTEMLGLIRLEIEGHGIKFCYLDGGTPAEKRKELIESFQNDPSIKVFLISLKAGGVGLNLTAADYVYIVDPWWNPATEVQAIDRAHRIGQDKTVFAYKMICKDSVEEKILTLQENKISISKDLIADDGAFFKKLTRQDVEFLFS
ncbi:MAG: DEAD/DEAH box helicase [Saprospiraceae bacterium]